jgi:hypothetical protein
MPYEPHANYETINIQEEPHGEIVTTASGEAVLIVRPGGTVRYQGSFLAHFGSHPGGYHAVGDVFTVDGIEFVAQSVSYVGKGVIKGIDGKFFDARTYEIHAVSTKAYPSTGKDISLPLLGGSEETG